jgi:hypothetical protein
VAVSEGEAQLGLSLGGLLPVGGGFFCVSQPFEWWLSRGMETKKPAVLRQVFL